MWYDPNAIANILSFKRIKVKFMVKYDSSKGDAFIGTKPDGKQHCFEALRNGFYYLNTQVDKKKKDNDHQEG